MIDNQIVYDGDEDGLDDAEPENIDTVENTPKENVQFQENPNSAYIIDEYLGLAIKSQKPIIQRRKHGDFCRIFPH